MIFEKVMYAGTRTYHRATGTDGENIIARFTNKTVTVALTCIYRGSTMEMTMSWIDGLQIIKLSALQHES